MSLKHVFDPVRRLTVAECLKVDEDVLNGLCVACIQRPDARDWSSSHTCCGYVRGELNLVAAVAELSKRFERTGLKRRIQNESYASALSAAVDECEHERIAEKLYDAFGEAIGNSERSDTARGDNGNGHDSKPPKPPVKRNILLDLAKDSDSSSDSGESSDYESDGNVDITKPYVKPTKPPVWIKIKKEPQRQEQGTPKTKVLPKPEIQHPPALPKKESVGSLTRFMGKRPRDSSVEKDEESDLEDDLRLFIQRPKKKARQENVKSDKTLTAWVIVTPRGRVPFKKVRAIRRILKDDEVSDE